MSQDSVILAALSVTLLALLAVAIFVPALAEEAMRLVGEIVVAFATLARANHKGSPDA